MDRSKLRTGAIHFTLTLIVFLTVVLALLLVASIWPYNDIRFGSQTSTVLTPVVKAGGNVTVKNASYCNDDRDVFVERWADVLDSNMTVIGSYQIPGIEFFNKGKGLRCFKPSIATFTLPVYVTGPNGTNSYFRIRQIWTYKPNPVRVVKVAIDTEPFLILSESK